MLRENDLVTIIHCPGVYRVICVATGGDVLLRGFDSDGKRIASLDRCGTIVVNRKELKLHTPDQETLL